MTKSLIDGAKQVIQKLLEHGYEAYMVGGCVRDIQLNRPVKDYDIATSARPEQVQRLFPRTIPTGLQHGTVSVIADGHLYEVTTYRRESGYADFRRPSEVEYIDSLAEDLQRRDFTMNAMAMDLHGKLLDPFHGVEDMKNRLLRCVGDADERFQEDALRMLRCIRFAAEYGLDIERHTWQSLLKQAPLLSHIAMERVRMELERMNTGSAPDRAIRLLIDSGLLSFAKHPLKLAGLQKEKLSAGWAQLSDEPTRWAYLYLLLKARPNEIEQELRLLTLPKQQIDLVRRIVGAVYELADGLGRYPSPEQAQILEQSCTIVTLQYGKNAMYAVIDLAHAVPHLLEDLGLTGDIGSTVAEQGRKWLEELPVHSLDQLEINGNELMSRIGKRGGPWVAEVLKHVLYLTALKRLANEKNALLAEAERYADYVLQRESGNYDHK